MTGFTYTAHFDGIQRTVIVEKPEGMNSPGYEVSVDNFREGLIIKRDGLWFGYPNSKANWNTGDISAIGDRIDDYEAGL